MAMNGPIQRKDNHHHHHRHEHLQHQQQNLHETVMVDSRDVEEALRTTSISSSTPSYLGINRQGDNTTTATTTSSNNIDDDNEKNTMMVLEESSTHSLSSIICSNVVSKSHNNDYPKGGSCRENDYKSKPSSDNKNAGNYFSNSTTIILGLQVANILLWYWTNGMNGIAMQGYAGQINSSIVTMANEEGVMMSPRFWTVLKITSGVTSVQLLLGSLIGRILLFKINKHITWQQICTTQSISLSSLHACGSLATNLGFMYGKASVIQVIKLLEPFETLLLSQLFYREGNFTIGIVSSMIVVVGAAMSLLKLQSKPPSPHAIIFALLSGITLSTRNVLQRKHHHTYLISKSWTKLEKSLVQFTQLSFFSGLWMAAIKLILFLLVHHHEHHGQTTKIASASWQVFLWHPLYNIFSMITLGFCSALTHSLLNAGKRVFAICMAMIWFSEGLYDPATLSGLFAVASGGGWYSWEGKRKRSSSPTTTFVVDSATTSSVDVESKSSNELYKLIFSIWVLVSLFNFHSIEKQ